MITQQDISNLDTIADNIIHESYEDVDKQLRTMKNLEDFVNKTQTLMSMVKYITQKQLKNVV